MFSGKQFIRYWVDDECVLSNKYALKVATNSMPGIDFK